MAPKRSCICRPRDATVTRPRPSAAGPSGAPRPAPRGGASPPPGSSRAAGPTPWPAPRGEPHTTGSATPTCRPQWSQQRRCMFGVARPLRSVQQLTVHSRSSNVSAHPASNYTLGPTLMVLLVRRFNIGRTALQLSSPKIRKWQVVRHSAENLNNQRVNNP